MTSLASISPGTNAAAGTSPVAHAPRRAHDSANDAGSAPPPRSEGPGRRNPLVAAMMSALQSLLPGKTEAAPAATTPSAAETAGTSDSTATLRDAAYAFAHELFSALRGSGSGGDGGDDAGERRHHHHHHRHGHHRSEGSRGYGDLAQRLTALAQTIDGSAQASPATPATPVAQPAATASPEPSPSVADAATATPAAPAAPGTTIHITINVNLGGSAAANAAPKTAAAPLVDAFKHLFDALNPSSATASGGSSSASPAARLSAFLRQMAQSLRAGPDADATSALPRSGSLLNVSA